MIKIILIIASILIESSLYSQELPWPVEAAKGISSTFGEPRPGRFHLGVDFKSDYSTGKNVISLGDGFISRVRTSPFGYGKAMYVVLDNGETIVYGHLSGFLPGIEERLYHARIRKKSYDVDLSFNPDEFRVTQGQIIAFSGDTGAGPPHLHVEIRNRNNIPLNPLSQGLVVNDTTSPVIYSIVLIPLDNSSSVDGLPVPRWCDVSQPNQSPFHLSGKIGVGVVVWDTINGSTNMVGIYRVSLAIDSTTIFSKQYDAVSYSLNPYGGLDYIAGDSIGGTGFVSALFRRTGNLVDWYEGNGILDLKTFHDHKPHVLTISIGDYSGNTAKQTLQVVFSQLPHFLSCGYDGADALRIEGVCPRGRIERADIYREDRGKDVWIKDRELPIGASGGALTTDIPGESGSLKIILATNDSISSLPVYLDFDTSRSSVPAHLTIDTNMLHDCFVVRIVSSHRLASLPVIKAETSMDSGVLTCIPNQEGETSWIAAVPLSKPGRHIFNATVTAYDRSLARLTTEVEMEYLYATSFTGSMLSSPDRLFTVYIPPQALYRSTPVTTKVVESLPPRTLLALSKGYMVTFGDKPLKNKYEVRLICPSDPPEKTSLYLSGDNGRSWTFLSGEHKGSVFMGGCMYSGCFALFQDIVPPDIAILSPSDGEMVMSGTPLISVRLNDEGSGIAGSDSIHITIDGVPVYGEYDYEAHLVRYRPLYALTGGTHTVNASVTDRVGNTSSLAWSFTIAR